MKSLATERFWKQFDALPARVRTQAQRAYALWYDEPFHPSLQFKRVSQNQPIYSVRIGLGWRALGLLEDNTVYWFWIGSHDAYDDLLSRL